MEAESYQQLKASIAEEGLLNPITIHEDQVLDGVHREKACGEVGVEPEYEPFTGKDPLRFVLAQNLARRQLTVGQRAALAAEVKPLFEKRAKERKRAGNRRGGLGKSGATLPPTSEPSRKARDEAAAMFGVGGRTVDHASFVRKKDPALFERVKKGEIAPATADRQIKEKAAPKGKPRTRNWNGKSNTRRGQELRAGDYNELVELQLWMNQMCMRLAATDVDEFGLDDPTLGVVADLHDDLLTLADWVDRSLGKVTSWLSDAEVLDKIEKLERTNGRTPGETKTAQRLANRLRKKLTNRLEVG